MVRPPLMIMGAEMVSPWLMASSRSEAGAGVLSRVIVPPLAAMV